MVITKAFLRDFDAALASLSVSKAFAEAAYPWLAKSVADEPRDQKGRWVARDNKHPFPIEEDFPFVAPGKITGEMRASAPWHDVPLDGLIATQSWVIGRQVEQMAAAGTAGTERAEKPPVIVRMPDGRRYIEDGHHRATVAAVKGDSTVRAKVFDYDPETGEYTAAKVAKQLGTVRHPWLVRKTRDASGHEHASDGRFGTTSGSHKAKPAGTADRHGKPTERTGRDPVKGDPDAKAERLAARIAEVPKQLRAQVASFVRGRYRKLAKRYGPKGAMAIMGATIALLPAPIPGTSLIPIAVAEAVLAIRRAVRKSHDELDEATIQREARKLLRAIYAACGEEPPKVSKAFDVRHPWTVKGFDPSEPRDADGEWTTGGASSAVAEPPPGPRRFKEGSMRHYDGSENIGRGISLEYGRMADGTEIFRWMDDKSSPVKAGEWTDSEEAARAEAKAEVKKRAPAAKGYGKKWAAGLSDIERNAIAAYSSNSDAFNPKLRAGAGGPPDMAALDASLKRSVLPEDKTVYRGVQHDFINGSVGDTFTDRAYVSTSTERGTADQFRTDHGRLGEEAGALIEIRLPKGTNGADMTALSLAYSESEILLPRGSRFRITGIRDEGGTKIYEVERVSDKPTERRKGLSASKAKAVEDRPSRNNAYGWHEGDIEIERADDLQDEPAKGQDGDAD
jgi:hypothetical protein